MRARKCTLVMRVYVPRCGCVCVCVPRSLPSLAGRERGMRREGALHVPLDTARKGWGRHYILLTYSTYGTRCVCSLHTRVCRPTRPAGRPLSLREALQGPTRAWEPCPQQGHTAHTVCSMCVARTHVCAGLHTTLGGQLSLREALLGPTRAREHCSQRLLSYVNVCAR